MNNPNDVDPNHYKFPGGVEVRHLSQHLTSFGGQAVQYIARATRLDGVHKGDRVADLLKAIKFLEWEVDRLNTEPTILVNERITADKISTGTISVDNLEEWALSQQPPGNEL